MLWIEYRKGEDIPKELYYSNYKLDKDRNSRTPLMLWISRRLCEAIPEELYYPGC